jgi:hypothetical protein
MRRVVDPDVAMPIVGNVLKSVGVPERATEDPSGSPVAHSWLWRDYGRNVVPNELSSQVLAPAGSKSAASANGLAWATHFVTVFPLEPS